MCAPHCDAVALPSGGLVVHVNLGQLSVQRASLRINGAGQSEVHSCLWRRVMVLAGSHTSTQGNRNTKDWTMVRTNPLSQGLALAATFCILLSAMQPLYAQETGVRARQITSGELTLLPEWCIDSQEGPYGGPEGGEGLNRSPRARQWVSLMGNDFWHMHHYCRGLRDVLRLKSAGLSKPDRQFLTGRAIGEFTYIINNCKNTMPLLPEVYLKKGEVHMMRQELSAASDAFEMSRKLKPDYWPAYDRWIAVLLEIKQFDKARALAQEGLGYAPNQPNLTARLAAINAAAGKDKGQRASARAASGPVH